MQSIRLPNTQVGPDWVGQILETGFDQFSHQSGIHGLYKENGDHLELLVVVARRKGTGQFRKFINAAKETYNQISVWDINNPLLEVILTRYDFKPTKTVTKGEKLTGMTWSKL